MAREREDEMVLDGNNVREYVKIPEEQGEECVFTFGPTDIEDEGQKEYIKELLDKAKEKGQI